MSNLSKVLTIAKENNGTVTSAMFSLRESPVNN